MSHYRVLLPLLDLEKESFRPWSSFLPGGTEALEDLRRADLSDLRRLTQEAKQGLAGFDSARGRVSDEFVTQLAAAFGEFVPADATWTTLRWRGNPHPLEDAVSVTIGSVDFAHQEVDSEQMLSGLRTFGMPEYLWCSAGTFAWGSPLYPDYGLMTLSAQHWIAHFAPRGFEAFAVPRTASLPDNLGD